MKKVYQIIALAGLSFMTIGATAQTLSVSHPNNKVQHSVLKGSFHTSKKAMASGTYILNYDSADASIFESTGGTYVNNQGEVMNTKYAYPADTTGNGSKPSSFFQNNNCINFVTVAFDSIWDPYQVAGVSSTTVTNLQVDTLVIPIVQTNHSGHMDTLEVQLNSVDANGYATATKLADTMWIGTTLGAGSDAFIANVEWGLNRVITGAKFAVTVKYYDYTKLDTCWFIYGFPSFTGPCPTGSFSLADTSAYSIVKTTAAGGEFWANSFLLYNEYASYGTLPDKTGANIFYDCNGDGKPDAGDGFAYEEDINVIAMVTTNPNGINEVSANGLAVAQNAPNPFNKNSQINYNLTKSSDVVFSIYDLAGRKLVENAMSNVAPGQHVVNLNANEFTPGVYFYSFKVNGNVVTKRMVITE
ncbi:MAG TPA: T9SS type A sorting domain-containing protein [Bacteroidia bacterium]|jgi:hypothetical protein|nr:T9SS type A sorting domain-containing protein [Bacteroidia bacterium]